MFFPSLYYITNLNTISVQIGWLRKTCKMIVYTAHLWNEKFTRDEI